MPSGSCESREPTAPFGEIARFISLYPERVACYLDGHWVRAQGGGFYGGWVPDEIVRPDKGQPGTESW